MKRQARPLPATPPDTAELHQAALNHLARFATTEAGLARVLARRIDRWQREAAGHVDGADQLALAARAAIPGIVAECAALGAVNDAQFAQSRARALTKAGKSRRALGAWLAQRGVGAAHLQAALPEGKELAAALVHARKRRLGPWRTLAPSPELTRRELGNLARAGFPQSVAREALALPLEAAEAAIRALRNGEVS